MHDIANFKLWTWIQYNVILRKSWLNVVNAWIAYKHEDVHGKFFDSKPFKIKGKRTQPKVPFSYATHIK